MGRQTRDERIVASKKRHLCSWCDELIEVGDSYFRWRWYDGADASTVKLHPECFEAMNEMISLEGGSIEFTPGESPRGCCCGFEAGCKNCAAAAWRRENK